MMESSSASTGREEVMASSSRSCLEYVGFGAAAGGAVFGLAAGACRGTFDAFFTDKVPGLLKIRYIGRATLLTAAAGGIFVGSGFLIDRVNINRHR